MVFFNLCTPSGLEALFWCGISAWKKMVNSFCLPFSMLGILLFVIFVRVSGCKMYPHLFLSLKNFNLYNTNKSWPAWTLSGQVWKLPACDSDKLLARVKAGRGWWLAVPGGPPPGCTCPSGLPRLGTAPPGPRRSWVCARGNSASRPAFQRNGFPKAVGI